MNFSRRLEIKAHRQPWLRDSIAIQIVEVTTRDGQETVSLVQPLTLKVLTEEDMCRELPASLSLSPEDAQQFMDELWRTGVRPTEAAGSVGQLGAIKAHLEDMRTLVFKPRP